MHDTWKYGCTDRLASDVRVMPATTTRVSLQSFNAAFHKTQSRGHSRSVSPIIRHVQSSVGLSVMQHYVQIAQQTTAARVQTAQGVAKVALSEAAPTHGQVEQKIQPYMSQTEAGMSHATREAIQKL